MSGVGQKIFDIFYPIGSYYETSDTNFNPNTANSWYGTWVEDTAGRVLVSLDTTQTEFNTVGNTGGSKYIQDHRHTWANSNGRAFTGSNGWITINTGTQRSFPGADDTASNTGGVYTEGGVLTGNSGNLQPYIVIKRWHRTA